MKLRLMPFQEERTAELLAEFRSGRDEFVKRQKHQVVSLAAPTGSGKTVMATAFIEQLLFGDEFGTLGEHQEDEPGDKDYTFLWLTDSPELNEQTYSKMVDTSGGLDDAHLNTIDEHYDASRLEPGKVHFLNTHKLAKGSTNYVGAGDDRDFSMWQTIVNTVAFDPDHFVLILDEAQRGMLVAAEDRVDARGIVQRLIKGGRFETDDVLVEIQPTPLIVGISATIERFETLTAGTKRTQRSVEVTIDEVKESGLVKEATELKHSRDAEHNDITMLVAAIEEWDKFRRHWADYAVKEDRVLADPILMVQVQDGTKKVVSKSDLGQFLRTLRSHIDGPDDWYAHAFQEGRDLDVDGEQLRYLRPSAIDADPDVRVVLFKTSLNTGWDCPRAEVMVSFRVARDATMIAQLVGRMVRARMAHPVTTDDFLNTVSLYLPHFDDKGLTAIVERLNADGDTKTGATARLSGEVVYLNPAAGDVYDRCFAKAKTLPSYTLPPRRVMKPVVRLFKLARLLAETGWESSPVEDAKRTLTDVLVAESERLSHDAAFSDAVANRVAVVIEGRRHLYGATTSAASETTATVTLQAIDLDAMHADADRILGKEGLNNAFTARRRAAGQNDDTATKVELIQLAQRPEVLKKVDEAAHKATKGWFDSYRLKFGLDSTPEDQSLAFEEIQGSASQPELTTMALKSGSIEWPKSTKLKWDSHLFVDDQGEFYEDFSKSSWERLVVEEELKRGDIVAWLRNVDRKPWSLKLVYQVGTQWIPVYPDFIFFREQDGDIVADIVDPHLLTGSNTPERARGLANYAETNWKSYGRIELVIVEKKGGHDTTHRLNLMDEDTRKDVASVTTSNDLEKLFKQSG